MYQLLADSGSTKTDWVLLQQGKVIAQVKTIGFNPYFQTQAQIENELNGSLKPFLKDYISEINQVNYYGAGCSTPDKCLLLSESIKEVFHVTEVNVHHDLLAAARALCGREWGIAAILGTGSNSCLYNGIEILENVPSAGYLWSDYGGGSQIGKFFIRDYFEGRLPTDVKQAFENAGYNREEILNHVYKASVPSKYLASVSLFVAQHRQNNYVKQLLNECFSSFFEQQVGKYTQSKNYKVHTVGSVGFYYRDEIAEVARHYGYQMGKVIQSPMEGLIEYHLI